MMKLFNFLFLYFCCSCLFEVYFVWSDSSPDIDAIPQKEPEINVDNLNEEPAKLKLNDDLKEPASKTDDDVIKREEEAIKLDGFNAAQIKEMRAKQEHFKFQAEVDRMMKLIINSLYTNKEIFLRELISNASDALDKIRFMSLTDPSVLDSQPELSIRIKADKVNNMLTITDTGVGMTRNDLIKQLGTIANSGTADFLSKMDKNKATNIGDFIGQFGVGFYSVFLVSDFVTVISKHNDDDQHIWESLSSETFTVTKDPRGNTLKRGTQIVLRLKPSAMEYLEAENLRRLVRQYSQYLSFPIYLWGSQVVKENMKQEPKDSSATQDNKDSKTAQTEDKTKEKTEDKTEEKTEDKTEDKTETKTDSKTQKKKPVLNDIKWDWERINNNKPIWVRKPSEVTDEEYNNFYKALSRTNEEPLAKIHFNAEGEVSFKAILYIPKKAPETFLERDVKESSIRLYVRRVFITDKILDIIPRYLRFVIGMIDSDDLPLNVSRETLQQEKLLKVIQKKLVRKILDMIKKLDLQTYNIFWRQFRTGIKIGLLEDNTNRNRLSKLYRTFGSKTGDNLTSFPDYISRMKTQQNEIYYICHESLAKAKDSPFIEKFVKHNFEVLFFTESIDEHAISSLEKYEGTTLLNLAQSDVFFDKTDGNKAKFRSKKEEFKGLIDFLLNKVEIVKKKVQSIIISDRLLSVPMMVTPSDRGWTGNMERLAISQSEKLDPSMIESHLSLKKNLEINIKHPIIIEFNKVVSHNSDSNIDTLQLGSTLFNTALLNSGYMLNDTSQYATELENMMWNNLKRSGKILVDTKSEVENEEEDVGVVDEENKDKKEKEESSETVDDKKDKMSKDNTEDETNEDKTGVTDNNDDANTNDQKKDGASIQGTFNMNDFEKASEDDPVVKKLRKMGKQEL